MKPPYKTRVLQSVTEHDAFLDIVKAEGVRSYLEIGSAWGGTLWRTANVLPIGSRVVSVDFNRDPAAIESLGQCVERLRLRGYDAHLVAADSRAVSTIERVRALGPFDCVFIDGDHSLEGVTADWKAYGPMAPIVAFHDIGWNESWQSQGSRPAAPIGVPDLWAGLKASHRHVEIQLRKKQNYYGIGVLWRNETASA
jgi:hypothetical protein